MIPCLFLAYYNIDIIKNSLESLSKEKRLDISVLENKSEYTDSLIKPYLLETIAAEKIQQCFLFDENICNNTVDIVIRNNLVDLNGEFILITDGDLIPEDGWLDEQINILNNCPEVFACTILLSKKNLPLSVFPGANNWTPEPVRETELYFEVDTGQHLMLARTKDIIEFLRYAERNGLKYFDEHLRYYVANTKHMKWATAKKTKALHLTWDIYADINHPYTKLKLDINKIHHTFWTTDKTCGFTLYKKNSIVKFE